MSEGNRYGLDPKTREALSDLQMAKKRWEWFLRLNKVTKETTNIIDEYLRSPEGFSNAEALVEAWETMLNSFTEKHPVP